VEKIGGAKVCARLQRGNGTERGRLKRIEQEEKKCRTERN